MSNNLTDEQREGLRIERVREDRIRAGNSEEEFKSTGESARTVRIRRHLLSIIDTLTAELEAERGKVKETLVEVCVAEPSQPFICGWWGPLSDSLWGELEEQLSELPGEFIEGLPERTATVMCKIESFPGQYGEYGRCELAPYNMLYHIKPLQVTLYEADEPSPEPGADHD
jgi:hypothetical protein